MARRLLEQYWQSGGKMTVIQIAKLAADQTTDLVVLRCSVLALTEALLPVTAKAIKTTAKTPSSSG
jgi:hypothetical protein